MRPSQGLPGRHSHVSSQSSWLGIEPLTKSSEHRHRHGADRDGADDRDDPVEQEGTQAAAIEPAQIEQQQRNRGQCKQRRLQRGHIEGGAQAAERDNHAERTSTAGRGRAQEAPAGALQQPLQASSEGAALQAVREGSVAPDRQLAGQRK